MQQQLRTSQQKAKLEKITKEGEGTKGYKWVIQYTWLKDDGTTEPGKTAAKLAAQYNDDEKLLLKNLKAGAELVINKVEKTFTTSEGTERKTWQLANIADASTYKPKTNNNYNTNKNKFNKNYNTQDNISAKIGGLVHDAVAILGVGATVEQVGQTVRELLREVYTIEAEASTGTFKTASNTETKKEENDLASIFYGVDQSETDDFFADLGDVVF